MNYHQIIFEPETIWVAEPEKPLFFMSGDGLKTLLAGLDELLQSADTACIFKLIQSEATTPDFLQERALPGTYHFAFVYHQQQQSIKTLRKVKAQPLQPVFSPIRKAVTEQFKKQIWRHRRYQELKDFIDIRLNGNYYLFSGSKKIYQLLYNELLEFYQYLEENDFPDFEHIHLECLTRYTIADADAKLNDWTVYTYHYK